MWDLAGPGIELTSPCIGKGILIYYANPLHWQGILIYCDNSWMPSPPLQSPKWIFPALLTIIGNACILMPYECFKLSTSWTIFIFCVSAILPFILLPNPTSFLSSASFPSMKSQSHTSKLRAVPSPHLPRLTLHPNHWSRSSKSSWEHRLPTLPLLSHLIPHFSFPKSSPTPAHSFFQDSLSKWWVWSCHPLSLPLKPWKPSIIYKYKFRWCGMSFQVLVLFLFQPLFLPFLSICAFSKVYSKECKNLRGAPLLKSFRVRTRTTQPTLSHSWIVKMSVSTF